jgi:hypothetical protein
MNGKTKKPSETWTLLMSPSDGHMPVGAVLMEQKPGYTVPPLVSVFAV